MNHNKQLVTYFTLILTVIGCLNTPIMGYEHTMLNLRTASTLLPNQLVYGIEHRFLGNATKDPLDNFFGLDEGANVRMGLRYSLKENVDIDWTYTTRPKEHAFGIGYSFGLLGPIKALAHARYFTFKLNGIEKRQKNVMYLLGIQHNEAFYGFTPVLNIAYDGYNKRTGAGVGVEYMFSEDQGLLLEWFTAHNRDNTTPHNSISASYKIKSFGHRFMVSFANSTDIGTRRSFIGAENLDYTLGFEVSRLFDLGD